MHRQMENRKKTTNPIYLMGGKKSNMEKTVAIYHEAH